MKNWIKQWLKEFIHNCVIQPILPILPHKNADNLHDKNGLWTFNK